MNMERKSPHVSIGLPVYNGENYLKQAIDSILTQTFTDFELIISDNASTDSTPQICRQYAAQDKRIRYNRNSTNIGGAANANQTFLRSSGEYFRWSAHDDLCAPELLGKCIEALDRDPDLVLAYPITRIIDEDGNELEISSHKHAVSTKASERFRKVACSYHYCDEIYGVIRSNILRKTRLMQKYTSSDRVLLSELSLYGRFYEVPEVLFSKRLHSGNVFVDWRARMVWFDPKNKGKIVFPFWMQFFDYLATIHRVPLSTSERLLCYPGVIRWIFLRGGKSMLKDLLVAGYMGLHGSAWRTHKQERGINWE